MSEQGCNCVCHSASGLISTCSHCMRATPQQNEIIKSLQREVASLRAQLEAAQRELQVPESDGQPEHFEDSFWWRWGRAVYAPAASVRSFVAANDEEARRACHLLGFMDAAERERYDALEAENARLRETPWVMYCMALLKAGDDFARADHRRQFPHVIPSDRERKWDELANEARAALGGRTQ